MSNSEDWMEESEASSPPRLDESWMDEPEETASSSQPPMGEERKAKPKSSDLWWQTPLLLLVGGALTLLIGGALVLLVVTYETGFIAWEAVLSVAIYLSGPVVMTGCLLAPGRRLRDWLMIVGSTMVTIGIGVAAFFGNPNSGVAIGGLEAGLGSIGCGALLFAMGFLMDQIDNRRRHSHEEQLTGIVTSRKRLAEERSASSD